MNFTYKSFPNQIHFGAGKIKELPNILNNYLPESGDKVMVFAESWAQAKVDALAEAIGSEKIYHFSKIIQHVPQTLVDRVLDISIL